MQSFTIHAGTAYSARAIAIALSQFDLESTAANGQYEVTVKLGDGDREIGDVLNALAVYVTERANGPAHIDFAGRAYTLHPGR